MGLGRKGTLHKTFALLCAALCVCVVNNLGVICNGILGPKEYPLGDICFWPKPFFLEPHESPDAAAIIPLRVGSKATGNSRFFLTAFFFKAQHSSLTLPLLSPSGWVTEPPNLPEQELSLTVQYGLLGPRRV